MGKRDYLLSVVVGKPRQEVQTAADSMSTVQGRENCACVHVAACAELCLCILKQFRILLSPHHSLT